VGFDSSTVAALAVRARAEFGYHGLLAMKDPPWGPLSDITEEEFGDLGTFTLVVECSRKASTWYDPGRRGMHRPIPGLVLMPDLTSLRAHDPGRFDLMVENHPVGFDLRPSDTTRAQIVIKLGSRPRLDAGPLDSGQRYDVAFARISGERMSLTITQPATIIADSSWVRVIIR
jgi:hypothetical protein